MIIGMGLLGATAGVGGWALLADQRLAPGRGMIDAALGRCDLSRPAEATPGLLVRGSFFSAHRRRGVGYALAYPPRAAEGAELPVCLVLHGLGGNASSPFDEIGYQRLLAAAVAADVPPFVLASIDGGDAYWHPHASGDDPLGMLLHDFPTVLRQHGLNVERSAVLGWSMGGYGALLAATEAPQWFAAVAASGPAFWGSYAEARSVNSTAFDSVEEWERFGDLFARAGSLAKTAVRIDCGESDPFAPVVARLRERLPDPAVVTLARGCHDATYWRWVAPRQLRLIGAALAG